MHPQGETVQQTVPTIVINKLIHREFIHRDLNS